VCSTVTAWAVKRPRRTRLDAQVLELTYTTGQRWKGLVPGLILQGRGQASIILILPVVVVVVVPLWEHKCKGMQRWGLLVEEGLEERNTERKRKEKETKKEDKCRV
jgi:hypothetical protein